MLATFTALCEELHLCVVVFQQYNDKRYKNSLLKFMLCIVWSYLLTPWCRVLLEQLTGLQLVKKFPAFHGTRRFITALTSVRHLSLSWATPKVFDFNFLIHTHRTIIRQNSFVLSFRRETYLLRFKHQNSP